MATERPGHDLQATALINEAYLRLVDWRDIQWADCAYFFGMAASTPVRVDW
jgi:ECF sigma factor